MLRKSLWAFCLALIPFAAAQSATPAPRMVAEGHQEKAVLASVHAFLDALGRKDRAAMQAQAIPQAMVTSLRDGALRRLSIEQVAQIVEGIPARIAEPIRDPIVHIDENVAVVWAPYAFLSNGKVTHCGTDVFNFLFLDGRWVIAGLADNSRKECSAWSDHLR